MSSGMRLTIHCMLDVIVGQEKISRVKEMEQWDKTCY